MKKNNYNLVLFISLSFAIIMIIVFMPQSCGWETVSPPKLTGEEAAPFERFIRQKAQPPDEFILSAFENHDIILLGQFYGIKEHIDFLTGLVPGLYDHNILVGIEYALYQDQNSLDRLLSQSQFDQDLAREILFNYSIANGFNEYMALLEAAWSFNRDHTEKPFRLIALSPKKELQYIQKEEDLNDPAIIQKVFKEGLDSDYMAQVVIKEAIDKGRKMLVFCDLIQAFTRFEDKSYSQFITDLGFKDANVLGNIIYDRIGGRAETVLLHSPWNGQDQGRAVYPAGGMIEATLFRDGPTPKAFIVPGGPFAALSVQNSQYASGYDKLSLEDLCDGYVALGPIGSYTACTPIPGFVNESNVEQARLSHYQLKDPQIKVEDINKSLEQQAQNITLLIGRFEL